MCSSAPSARRPSVTTGGCSRKSTVSGMAPCETAPARERCSSQASMYGTCPSWSRYAPLAAVALPPFEPLAEILEEPSGVGTVDQAVVVRQRDVHDRLDRNRVVAAVVLDPPRPLDERVRPEDRRLRLADHGRAVEGAVAAGV